MSKFKNSYFKQLTASNLPRANVQVILHLFLHEMSCRLVLLRDGEPAARVNFECDQRYNFVKCTIKVNLSQKLVHIQQHAAFVTEKPLKIL